MRIILCSIIVTLLTGCCCKTTGIQSTSNEPAICTIEEHFFECVSGDGVYAPMDCALYDYDGDFDVDIRDLAIFACQSFSSDCAINSHFFECLGKHVD